MESTQAQAIETSQARVQRTSDALVEIHFKADATLDAAGIGEVIAAKRALCTDGEPDVLAVVDDAMEVDLRVVNIDHHTLHGVCGNARRLAFVTGDELNAKLAEIHFRYFPRNFETNVFRSEEDARRWLAPKAQPSLS
jgi:hypothetical protein